MIKSANSHDFFVPAAVVEVVAAVVVVDVVSVADVVVAAALDIGAAEDCVVVTAALSVSWLEPPPIAEIAHQMRATMTRKITSAAIRRRW